MFVTKTALVVLCLFFVGHGSVFFAFCVYCKVKTFTAKLPLAFITTATPIQAHNEPYSAQKTVRIVMA